MKMSFLRPATIAAALLLCAVSCRNDKHEYTWIDSTKMIYIKNGTYNMEDFNSLLKLFDNKKLKDASFDSIAAFRENDTITFYKPLSLFTVIGEDTHYDDDSINDSEAIQAAINAGMDSAGGGKVYIPRGDSIYKVSK